MKPIGGLIGMLMIRNTYILSIFLQQVHCFQIEVKVKQGTVIGTTEETLFEGKRYFAFYGVPYARVPIKNLRFRDPKPMKKWEYHLDATMEFRGSCAQSHIVHKHGMYGTEDCLHLNIYTPVIPKSDKDFLRSVIVYVHGYEFTSSFSHIHGADFLIDNDVVFVSLTHRIGVFGFLKADDTDSNMGLKDIVMGLKWIRKNIKEFGGDEKKVTLMGSGSGATFISLLLTTKAKKLFSKLILQSGSVFSPSIFQNDHTLERFRLQEILLKGGKGNITKAPTKDLIQASTKLYSNKEVINLQKPIIPFSPIVEVQSKKSLLTQTSEDYFARSGSFNLNKPILIGYNSRESISEVIPFILNPLYLKMFSGFFKFMIPFAHSCKFNYTSPIYKEVSSKIKAFYFQNSVTEKSLEDMLRYTTDLRIYPIYKFIRRFLEHLGNDLYVYKFNHVGKFNAIKATSLASAKVPIKGASTGDEVCYLLKCEPLWEVYSSIRNVTEDTDRVFIKQMAEMWANFAKTSNPTPPHYSGDFTWLPMAKEYDNVLHIGKPIKLTRSKNERKMYDFWNSLYIDHYSPKHCPKSHDEL